MEPKEIVEKLKMRLIGNIKLCEDTLRDIDNLSSVFRKTGSFDAAGALIMDRSFWSGKKKAYELTLAGIIGLEAS